MKFTINASELTEDAFWLKEKEAYSGVHKIADKVMKDIELVFGVNPNSTENIKQLGSNALIFGTIDRSPVLNQLSQQALVDLDEIREKNAYNLNKIDETIRLLNNVKKLYKAYLGMD